MNKTDNLLFQPFTLGDLLLPNRIAMAPLTRNRATHGSDAQNDLNALYYAQGACAGLILTGAQQMSRQGPGYSWTHGFDTDRSDEST